MASELIITANGSTPVTGASFGYFAAGLPLEFNFISAGEFVAQWRTFFGGYEVHFSGQATIDPNGDPYLLDGFSLTLTGATLYTVQPDGSLTAIATATMPVFTYAADFAAGDGYQPIVDQFSNITGYRLFVNPQPLKDYIESLDRVVFVGSEINDTYDASYHHSATLMNGGGGDDFLVGARDRRNELFGGEGNDQLLGQGTNDYLDGGAGNDIVNDYEISLNGVVTHDADTLIGGAGADQLTSFGGDDRLFGGEGDDYLLSAATAGSVTHVGDAGNDVIDGGADTDTSVYSGNRADYNVTFMANGRYSITDLRSGSPDGTDTVLNVEYFQFADQTVPVSGIINQAPIAAFTSNANPAAPGQAIAFDASASYDPDGLNHIVSYSWNFGDGSALLVSASTTASHAYALFGTYTVTLTVTEDSVPALTGVATISEIVSQGNHAPVANAGGPYTFQAGSVLTLNGTGSFDPDMSAGDSIISYNWDLNNDGTFDVTSVSPTTVATFAHLQSLGLTGGSYIVTLSVTDSFGVNATASTTLFVNNPPTVTESLKNDTGALSTDKITSDPTLTGTADAGATVTLSEGNITLGTTTADNNGVWTFTPTSLAEGPHTIVASETDAFGNTGTASLTTAPVAFYAFDEASGNIAYDQEGTHDGTVNGASYVPGITSDALSFAPGSYGVSVPDSSDWNFGSGDFSITVWANFGSVPSGSAGELGDVLVAHDEGGGFTNKWVFDAYSEHLGFHVNNHEGNLFFAEAPFNPTPGQWYFLALSKWGSEYQFYVNGQLVGTDIETAPLSDASAELTIGYVNDGSRPSNEYALDNVGIYHNALSQADLAQIYQAGIGGTTINVSGAFTLDTTPPAVTESLANDTGASASDHITSDPTLTGSGDPNAVVHFMVDGIAIAQTATADGSGAWTFAPTGLADGSHTILASETDAAGNTGTASLTFTLDEAPTITSFGGADHVTISRPENNAAVTTVTAADPDAGQTLSYSIVGGVDQNLFTIDETTGALAFVTAPNFEALADADGDNVYDVIVQVSDGNGGTDTQAIAVTVTNENEAPRLVDDAPTGGTSGYQVNPANGHLYKYVSGNFTFEEAEALAATSGAYLATITSQQEQDFIYQNLTLRADGGTNFGWLGGSDREVEGTWRWIGGPEKGVQFWQGVEASSGGQGFGYTNFGITEPNESGPEDYLAFGTGAFPQSATPYQWVDYHNFGVPAGFYLEIGGLAARSVAENTTAVTTVAASDPDAGDTLSYSIVGGADAALFTIDANTGALTFLTAPDFEAPADAGGDNVYDVTVQVSDGNGGTDTQAIAVTVTDVDEIGPTLLSIVATDNTPTNASVVHYTVTFSEVVTGVDASQFALNSSGVSGASIAGVTEVTGSGGTQYTVTVNTGSGDGTVELDLIGTDISDLAGNVLPGGSFQVAQSFSDITGHVTAADLNGDGYQDLVSESSPTTISVMLANGDGTFQPAVNYNAGHDLNGVSVADLNNDGRIDFAISNGGANGAVAVLLGNGDGTFQPAISSPTNSSYATNSAIADLNDDGNLDLTVANNANRGGVSVLLGNGDGTFSPSTVLASDGDPVTVAVADLNGDDIPDIAFSNVAYGAFDVQIYLGDGSGGFVEAPEIQAATHTLSVALDDLDRDGQNDLVFTSYDGTVSVALGNGDGTFGPVASYTVGLPSLGVGPGNVTIEDVNGDGAHDLLVASPLTNSLAVLLGNGDGTFQAAQQFATGGDGSGWVAVADFNGDGRPDAGVAAR